LDLIFRRRGGFETPPYTSLCPDIRYEGDLPREHR
jgi:hypothetical protein